MMFAAILAAALFTRSLGTFITVPDWQPTDKISSEYHAFGTYSGGAGSDEYWRLTEDGAAAVNALFDGAYERAWLGRDYGLGVVTNNRTGKCLPVWAQSKDDWDQCYGGDPVGVNPAWDAGEDRVITNSYRLLSWSNLTATAVALAHGDHRGWAAEFSGEDLRSSVESGIEPPVGEDWVDTFPCSSGVVASAWCNVFPVYSMLEEDDGSMYDLVRNFPRRRLGEWLDYAHMAAGATAAWWVEGDWSAILATPLGGRSTPVTPAKFYQVNVPTNDAVRLSRHFDGVVDVYQETDLMIANYLVGVKTNSTSNVVYRVRDVNLRTRQPIPGDTIKTNTIGRSSIRLEDEAPTMTVTTNYTAGVTNVSPPSVRLDWYKAGALNRLEGAMTSTYSVTNDLHLCRGRDEGAVATYAWLSNSIAHGVSVSYDHDGLATWDTNQLDDVGWHRLAEVEMTTWSTNRLDAYHPTFRAAAGALRIDALADMRAPIVSVNRFEPDADEALLARVEPVYSGLGFELRGSFVATEFSWRVAWESMRYSDGVTNDATTVASYVKSFGGDYYFAAEDCAFNGGLAKSASVIVFDAVDASLVALDATNNTNLAGLIPPRAIWNYGYVSNARVYTIDALLSDDEYPRMGSLILDPQDDVRVSSPKDAITTAFRVSTTDASSFDAVRGELITRSSQLIQALTNQVAVDTGRAARVEDWARAHNGDVARFSDHHLPWRAAGWDVSWGITSVVEKIILRGHIEISSGEVVATNAIVDSAWACDDSFMAIEQLEDLGDFFRVGWFHGSFSAGEEIESPVEERGGVPYPRTSRYQIDGHSLPLIRTDWRWQCLTPTD